MMNRGRGGSVVQPPDEIGILFPPPPPALPDKLGKTGDAKLGGRKTEKLPSPRGPLAPPNWVPMFLSPQLNLLVFFFGVSRVRVCLKQRRPLWEQNPKPDGNLG